MKTRLLTCVALAATLLFARVAHAQDPPEDPFGGGFPINQDAEIFTMGTQNDSLHAWGFDWLLYPDSTILIGEGSFPESYQCGDKRDIAAADFDGDYMDELVVAWNRSDGGVFVGIPTIDRAILTPDPAGWHVPDPPIASGVLYAADRVADLLGEIRVVAGNFCDDPAMEFVLAYLAADSTVNLSVFDVDSATLTPVEKASISDQTVNTQVAPLQQVGKLTRFDVTTGDFDGDKLDEIVLVVDSVSLGRFLIDFYDYDTLTNTIVPRAKFFWTYPSQYSCLRQLAVAAGNFFADTSHSHYPDSIDEIAILYRSANPLVDNSRYGVQTFFRFDPELTLIMQDMSSPMPYLPRYPGGEPGIDYIAYALFEYDDKLIVGGDINSAGGTAVNYVAAWDGSSWSSLGEGMSSHVFALTEYNNQLIAGGQFDYAGGTDVNCIAAWDGSQWSPLASGLSGIVRALTVYNGDLIAGGDFLFADPDGDNINVRRIARWDGSQWHAIEGGYGQAGFDARSRALIEYNGDLIAAGDFVYAYWNGNYVNARRIARWDGSQWNVLQGGLNDIARALAVYNGDLITGGNFTYADPNNVNARRIARWDGSQWYRLEEGFNWNAHALTVYNGDLIAGGEFALVEPSMTVNRIARWDGSTWHPMGSGMSWTVRALTVYDGRLIAGGSFDSADGTHVNKVAVWDGSNWQPLLPNVDYPMDLAAKAIDPSTFSDSFAVKELLFMTSCRENASDIEQYIVGYGGDPDEIWPASIFDTMVVGTITLGHPSGDLYSSRRTMSLEDVTGDGQVDLAMLLSGNMDTTKIEVFELYPDTSSSATIDSVVMRGSWATDTDDMSELVLADLDTNTIVIGKPTYYRKTDIVQPLVVLNAPPVHFDVINDKTDTVDVNFRYFENPDNCETYSVYQKKTGYTMEMSTEVRRDWGVSSSLDVSVGTPGAKVKAHMGAEYGEQFSEVDETGETIEFTATVTTGDDDQIYATVVNYDVWEYPILRNGVQLEGGGLLVVSPQPGQDVFSASKNPDREQWIPNHEVENALSYPNYGILTDNFMVASENVLTKGNTGFTLDEYPWSASWAILQTDFSSEEVEEEWHAGVDVSASYQTGGSFLFGLIRWGMRVSVGFEYNQSELQTYKTTVTDACSLGVYLGCINTNLGVCNYTVTPYAYWANTGALVVDYTTSPMVAGQGEDPTWWQINYGDRDPAFVLPWRLDDVKGEPLASEEARYKTREILFNPDLPNPGEVVIITARIHNFGLEPILDPVGVSFYLGDPGNGGQPIYEDGSGDSIFYTSGGILPQDVEFVTFNWQVPGEGSITSCQRIWAVIDPLDEISPEVHDNGDWATNNKGWKLLYVNTATECIDRDGDGWEESAYRCCSGLNQWDNCPDVYNPDQNDTDGDGIGDACETVVLICGDASGDETLNVGDAVFLINYIFKGGPAPDPLCVGDASGDDTINVGDAVYLINYIFKGGPAPVEPCCP